MNQNLEETDRQLDLMGRRIARRLDDDTDELPYAVTERLRAARIRAVAARRLETKQHSLLGVELSTGGATLQLGHSPNGRWNRFTLVFPMLALLAGMFLINWFQDETIAAELAEIDAELLSDDLPPAAFTDPGFAQYLRSHQASGSTQ